MLTRAKPLRIPQELHRTLALVSYGCYHKWPQSQWIKTTIYLCLRPEARNLKPKCWQALCFLESLIKNLSQDSILDLGSQQSPWVLLDWQAQGFNLYLCLHIAFSASFLHLSSLLRTLATGFKVHSDPGWSHLNIHNSITTAVTLFPNKVTITVSKWIYVLVRHH